MGIITEMINQVAPVHIEHGAERSEGAETDFLAQAPIKNRRAERAALADESDTPGVRHVRSKRGVKLRPRRHHAEAVWTDDAHIATPCFRKDLLFQCRASRADFLKPSRN